MKLNLIDYFLIVVFILVLTNSFYIYKYYNLKGRVNELKEREELYRRTLENNYKVSKELEVIKLKEIDGLKARLNNKAEQNIKYIYKTKYEKVNSTPDSLQSNLTDSILTECREKPFKRD